MTKKISPVFTGRQFDDNGRVLSGGNVSVFTQGSATILAPIFSDAAGTVFANPVVLSNGGLPPAIFLTSGVSYNFVLKSADGVVIQSFSDILI